MAGNDEVRLGANGLLRRPGGAPRAGLRPARVRADANYFDAALANTAVESGCDERNHGR